MPSVSTNRRPMHARGPPENKRIVIASLEANPAESVRSGSSKHCSMDKVNQEWLSKTPSNTHGYNAIRRHGLKASYQCQPFASSVVVLDKLDISLFSFSPDGASEKHAAYNV